MATSTASPDDLRRAARRLHAAADPIAAALDGVLAGMGPDVWRGPAADRFATQVHAARQQLRTSAEGLRQTAVRLDARARALEAQLTQPPR